MGFSKPSAASTTSDAMKRFVLTEHFCTNNAGGNTNGTAYSGGGDCSTTTASSVDHPGVLQLSTVASSTATPTWSGGSLCYKAGNGALSVDFVFHLPTALSDGTNTYQIYCGFGNSTTAEPTSGAYLTYTHSLNSGNFVFKTASASSRTSLNTSVTAASNTWYRGKIVFNSAGTEATCYLSTSMASLGSALGTISTNIPTANLFGTQISAIKSVGTSARALWADMLEVVKEFA